MGAERVIHSLPRRCEKPAAHMLKDTCRARRPGSRDVPGRNAREKCTSELDSGICESHRAPRAETCISPRRAHFAPPVEHVPDATGARAPGALRS